MTQRLDNRNLDKEIPFSNLSLPAQRLFTQLSRLECGYLIVCFLHARSTTYLTPEDLAYHLAQPVESVAEDLLVLEQHNLVQQIKVAEVSFYCLKVESEQGQLLDELWHWQMQWDKRIRQMQCLIWGDHSAQWDIRRNGSLCFE